MEAAGGDGGDGAGGPACTGSDRLARGAGTVSLRDTFLSRPIDPPAISARGCCRLTTVAVQARLAPGCPGQPRQGQAVATLTISCQRAATAPLIDLFKGSVDRHNR